MALDEVLNRIPKIAELPALIEHDPFEDYDTKMELARCDRYQLSPGSVVQMLVEQGGRCGVCRTPITIGRCHVDHCHVTGVVRGLLCATCNNGLGSFKDDPALLRAAADYLEVAK